MRETKTKKSLDIIFNQETEKVENASFESVEKFDGDIPQVTLESTDADGQLIPLDEYEGENNEIKETFQSDYESVRENLKELLDKGSPMLDLAIQLAEGTENPKNVENVIKLIGQLSEVNMKLLDATDKKQVVFTRARPKVNDKFNDIMNGNATNITNNTMFVGSPNDLMNFLKKENQKELENKGAKN